ncbi:MAG: CooT family nickel-binding protein [Thermoplasmata archaeon]|nr:CooT family nickel-binding protein [Thermoplasmata archaeon]NIS12563.1 CooT family nickel-binding protein [Thermoplasmata archaeon]NIS20481.1 CooT family nickel-binding protein [Thermoplasmata archaeon]NIT77843.1 CooT family nickel-binding protein [Thermoplasmata archaeon]NIU49570.1 CooT family nickel-binding protein [Thermoplasmata archaeon]
MCESKVFLQVGEDREHVMDDVVRMEIEENGVRVFDIIGQETFVEGARVKLADLLAHQIVLEK